jgi:hypothetical protein
MCNNGECNRSIEGFTVREHFNYNFGRGKGKGKYCKPFPGNAACKSHSKNDRCYPKSSLNACKASCGKGCYGISYDSSRKWCVKCNNFKSMGTYGSWNSYKRGGIVQCNVSKTRWIGSIIFTMRFTCSISWKWFTIFTFSFSSTKIIIKMFTYSKSFY